MAKQAQGQQAKPLRCPMCDHKVAKDSPQFPFCSERCRLTDLGKWAMGDYRIPGEPARIPDESEEN